MKKSKQLIRWILSYSLILVLSLLFPFLIYQRAIRTVDEVSLFGHRSSLQQFQMTTDALLEDITGMLIKSRYYLSSSSVTDYFYKEREDSLFTRFHIQQLIKSLEISRTADYRVLIYYGGRIITSGASYGKDEFLRIKLGRSGLSPGEWDRILKGDNSRLILPLTVRSDVGLYSQNIVYFSNRTLGQSDGGAGKQSCFIVLLNDEAFRSRVERSGWFELGNTFIINEEGTRIYGDTDERLRADLVERLSREALVRDRDWVYLSRPSDQMSWTYISRYPVRLFHEKAIRLRRLSALMSIFVLILGGTAAFYFSRRNYRPLSDLVEYFRSNYEGPEDEEQGEYAFIEEAAQSILLEKESIEERLERQGVALKRQFLSTLMKGRYSFSDEELKELLEEKGISLPAGDKGGYQVLLMAMERTPESLRAPFLRQDGGSRLLDSVTARTARARLGKEVLFCEYGEYQVLILPSIPPARSEELLEGFCDSLEERTGFSYTLALSSSKHRAVELSSARAEAGEVLEYCLLLGESRILIHSELESGRERTEFNLGTEMRFINSIRSEDYELAGRVFSSAVDGLIKRPGLSPDLLKARVFGMVNLMLSGLGEISHDLDEAFMEALNPAERILHSPSLEDIRREAEAVFSELNSYAAERKARAADSLAADVDAILERRLLDPDLSVGEIADEMGMAVSTLSLSFKQKTGTGLLDHIHGKRIEQAKDRIRRDGEASIRDIAAACGYRSDISFNRTFKKYIGMTPGQYKKLGD